MKKNRKRMTSFLLSALLLFLSSCSIAEIQESVAETTDLTEENVEEITVEEPETNSYAEEVASLPNYDYGGRDFRIATDTSAFFVSSGTTSYVGKEQYLRNLAVEEKYHVNITLTDESGLPTITERIKTEALAGADFCDLVVLQNDQFQLLVSNDLLVNVRTVPYLDLSGNGIHTDSVLAATLGSMTYGFTGDFIFEPDDLFAVFFNKTLLAETQLPDLYELVRENQWDFENFLLYAEEVYAVSRAAGNKISGFVSTESREDLINILWAASGQRFLQNEYGERPSLIYDNETTDAFVSAAQKMLFQSIVYTDATELATHNFAAGDAFFLIAPLSTAEELARSGSHWGVIPLPKQDINQAAFYSYISGGTCYAGFTNGTADLAFSGIITNAICRASSLLTNKVAITEYLNLYLNAAEDAEMMRLILASPYYDPVEFFDSLDASIAASTQTLLYRTISSEGKFDTLYAQYTKMFDKFLNEKL